MKRQARKSRLGQFSKPGIRKLHVESLEHRRMLATFTVGSGDTIQEAINDAAASPGADVIEIAEGTYHENLVIVDSGSLALVGQGGGAIIDNDGDLLVSSGGADLSLSNLTFQNGKNGVLVPVPEGAKGTVSLNLDNVTIQDNDEYGLHFSDQANDSSASVQLDITNSSFTGNGKGAGLSDFDGVRVDEGGKGNITANVSNSHFDGNGADGLEVDESGAGNIRLSISDSTFDVNGSHDPDDLEDGIDVDEAGAGSVWAKIVDSTFNGNADEGIDLDEEMDGNIHVSLLRVDANDNEDEGIKIDEKHAEEKIDGKDVPIPGTAGGNLFVSLVDVEASGNESQEGIAITEEGDGNLTALLRGVVANGNDKEGIEIVEEGDGNLIANLRNVTAIGNDDDGIQIEEADRGNLSVVVMGVTAKDNDKYGLKVEQGDAGEGSLVLGDADLLGDDDLDNNGKGELDTDGVIVTEV